MASSSGTYKEGSSTQQAGLPSSSSSSSSPYINGNSVSMHGGGGGGGEWGVPTFQHQQTISMDWTPEEQALLEEGLTKYASESNIIRYAKIAVLLKNKTVRDVALRCRWMTKKEMNKKKDFNVRKLKDRKEKVMDSPPKPCHQSIQSGLAQFTGWVPNGKDNNIIPYNDINGATRLFLQRNAWTFKQISANLVTHQIHENVTLLSQARDNIFQILANLNEMDPTMKKMPPLPKVNEELANSILPPSSFTIH